jgi:thiol-disulfide isomerase/thioredoxin
VSSSLVISRETTDQIIQSLAPIYEELADAFSHAKDKVVIAKVDADGVGKPLGKKYGVTGYPSAFAEYFPTSAFG